MLRLLTVMRKGGEHVGTREEAQRAPEPQAPSPLCSEAHLHLRAAWPDARPSGLAFLYTLCTIGIGIGIDSAILSCRYVHSALSRTPQVPLCVVVVRVAVRLHAAYCMCAMVAWCAPQPQAPLVRSC